LQIRKDLGIESKPKTHRKKGTKDRPFIPQSIMHMPKANITRAAICKKISGLLAFLKKTKTMYGPSTFHIWPNQPSTL